MRLDEIPTVENRYNVLQQLLVCNIECYLVEPFCNEDNMRSSDNFIWFHPSLAQEFPVKGTKHLVLMTNY